MRVDLPAPMMASMLRMLTSWFSKSVMFSSLRLLPSALVASSFSDSSSWSGADETGFERLVELKEGRMI
jgi:hypothetical protein